MKVKLISYQENALELLLYTKNTRLQGAQSLEDILSWPLERKLQELGYMRDTIASSWEFCNYIFEINGVTRAFTHQLVRTRNASYAQESHRAVDPTQQGWLTPKFDKEFLRDGFEESIQESFGVYRELVRNGAEPQDARGVIPTNTLTSIIMGCNLRTLSQMAEVRLCVRTQGEYQNVFKAMKAAVVEVHPWAEDFIQVHCVKTGNCCFPRYTECPIQHLTYNCDSNNDHNKHVNRLKDNFELMEFEANPVAKDGRTQ